VVESESSGTTFAANIPPLASSGGAEAAHLPDARDSSSLLATAVTAEQAGSSAESPDDAARGEDVPSLLVVDDSADLRSYVRDHFAGRFRVLEAADGAEGIALARSHLPDVVLSDVMMPGTDGHELVRVLRASAETDFLSIILLTAQAEDEQRLTGLERGADEYIVKPFEMRELDVRVRNLILSRRRLRERFLGLSAALPSAALPSAALRAGGAGGAGAQVAVRAVTASGVAPADPGVRRASAGRDPPAARRSRLRRGRARGRDVAGPVASVPPRQRALRRIAVRPDSANATGRRRAAPHRGRGDGDRRCVRGGIQQPVVLLRLLPGGVRRDACRLSDGKGLCRHGRENLTRKGRDNPGRRRPPLTSQGRPISRDMCQPPPD